MCELIYKKGEGWVYPTHKQYKLRDGTLVHVELRTPSPGNRFDYISKNYNWHDKAGNVLQGEERVDAWASYVCDSYKLEELPKWTEESDSYYWTTNYELLTFVVVDSVWVP